LIDSFIHSFIHLFDPLTVNFGWISAVPWLIFLQNWSKIHRHAAE